MPKSKNHLQWTKEEIAKVINSLDTTQPDSQDVIDCFPSDYSTFDLDLPAIPSSDKLAVIGSVLALAVVGGVLLPVGLDVLDLVVDICDCLDNGFENIKQDHFRKKFSTKEDDLLNTSKEWNKIIGSALNYGHINTEGSDSLVVKQNEDGTYDFAHFLGWWAKDANNNWHQLWISDYLNELLNLLP